MSNEINQSPYEDEIDIREIVLTLLRGWKWLLIITLLVGIVAGVISFLLPTVYEASTQILVDTSLGLSSSSTSTFLLSQAVYQKTNEQMGMALDPHIVDNKDNNKIPNISVVADHTDKNLYIITVQAETAQKAEQIANTWADQGVEYTNGQIQLVFDEENKELTAFEEADRALVEYLQLNSLSQLAWADMVILTGVSSNSNLLQPGLQVFPAISPAQRQKITSLMLVRMSAEADYVDANNRAIQTRAALVNNKPVVFKRATLPEYSIQPRIKLNIALGAIAGLMLAVFWVFLQDWWRKSKGGVSMDEG